MEICDTRKVVLSNAVGTKARAAHDFGAGKLKGCLRFSITGMNASSPNKFWLAFTNVDPTGKDESDLGDFIGANGEVFDLSEGLALAGSAFSIPPQFLKRDIVKEGFRFLVLIASGSTTAIYDIAVSLHCIGGVDSRNNMVEFPDNP